MPLAEPAQQLPESVHITLKVRSVLQAQQAEPVAVAVAEPLLPQSQVMQLVTLAQTAAMLALVALLAEMLQHPQPMEPLEPVEMAAVAVAVAVF